MSTNEGVQWMITLTQAPVQEFKPQFQNVKTMGLIICPELRRTLFILVEKTGLVIQRNLLLCVHCQLWPLHIWCCCFLMWYYTVTAYLVVWCTCTYGVDSYSPLCPYSEVFCWVYWQVLCTTLCKFWWSIQTDVQIKQSVGWPTPDQSVLYKSVNHSVLISQTLIGYIFINLHTFSIFQTKYLLIWD